MKRLWVGMDRQQGRSGGVVDARAPSSSVDASSNPHRRRVTPGTEPPRMAGGYDEGRSNRLLTKAFVSMIPVLHTLH